jgi:hypothetical protein
VVQNRKARSSNPRILSGRTTEPRSRFMVVTVRVRSSGCRSLIEIARDLSNPLGNITTRILVINHPILCASVDETPSIFGYPWFSEDSQSDPAPDTAWPEQHNQMADI